MNDKQQFFDTLILDTWSNRCKPLTGERESDIYYGFSNGWKARQDEIDNLRNICAEAYQLAGYYDAPVKALDNLSAAANGCKIPHDSFLPLESEASDTWLSQHDKAIEVKVLEEVAANVFISTTIRGDIELEQMIESRK